MGFIVVGFLMIGIGVAGVGLVVKGFKSIFGDKD